LKAECFFYSLDILYGGLGIGKLHFLILKNLFIFQLLLFFWSSKPWIRFGSQPKMLDPDPDQMNTDPKLCKKMSIYEHLTVSPSLLPSLLISLLLLVWRGRQVTSGPPPRAAGPGSGRPASSRSADIWMRSSRFSVPVSEGRGAWALAGSSAQCRPK
jgi:hypothetical protein